MPSHFIFAYQYLILFHVHSTFISTICYYVVRFSTFLCDVTSSQLFYNELQLFLSSTVLVQYSFLSSTLTSTTNTIVVFYYYYYYYYYISYYCYSVTTKTGLSGFGLVTFVSGHIVLIP